MLRCDVIPLPYLQKRSRYGPILFQCHSMGIIICSFVRKYCGTIPIPTYSCRLYLGISRILFDKLPLICIYSVFFINIDFVVYEFKESRIKV